MIIHIILLGKLNNIKPLNLIINRCIWNILVIKKMGNYKY